jgi:hypothetical protein
MSRKTAINLTPGDVYYVGGSKLTMLISILVFENDVCEFTVLNDSDILTGRVYKRYLETLSVECIND